MNSTPTPTEEGLHRQTARRKLTDLLGQETILDLHQKSNLWGWYAVLSVWVIIAAAMAVIVWAQSQSLWLAVPLIFASILVIGGRQLAMSILMHEASHRSLFKNVWLNDNVTNWLCGHPVFLEMHKYRKHHFIHHAKTGTLEDIDISLIRGFPTTRLSIIRKLSRDALGLTGVKALFGQVLMNAGVLKWTVASDIEKLPRDGKTTTDYIKTFFAEAWPTLLSNIVLFGIAYALGHAELYLVWVAAYLMPYYLFIRIRAIAEHALTEQTSDMLRNTRTTKAGFFARAFFAPFRVNFHIEHHALASVPYWQLPRLHRLLREKDAVPEPPSYWHVLDIVSRRDQAPAKG